ncbi:MAG TPA: DUF1549 domain-containing protein, partial [Pirellula sp.]|nr:DUF1549 domain-containing protein [Pirellula sp.]
MIRYLLVFLFAIPSGAYAPAIDESPLSDEDVQFFERKIRPILVQRCFSCHSIDAKVVHGGLRLDTAESVNKGGDSGKTLVAGQPAESLLIHSIQYESDIKMPPKGKLPAAEIKELTQWVRRGAPFPKSLVQSDQQVGQINFEEGRRFWSFLPVGEQLLPEVSDKQWPKTLSDTFVLSSMELEGLHPTSPTDRVTLIRRLSFDLVGLPPNPNDVRAFVNDESPMAFENLVERFMSSPQYGEKWARMWLDLARYTDRTESWLLQEGLAHFYRDWVVNAFNDDMPYDEFVHRQLAVDLMPDSKPQDLTALGFVG